MAKNIRQLNGYSVQDPASIDNVEYNPMSGAQKVTEVGRHLLPIPTGAGTWTTTPNSAAQALPNLGINLAVYNNTATVQSITLGYANTVASLAPGAIDSNGNVGIALAPNSWNYIACGMQNYVITSAATVLVYIIDDTSYIRQEVATFKGS